MQVPAYSNLRDLGRDHFHGVITSAQYRAARKQIIDRFVETEDTQRMRVQEGVVTVPVKKTEIRSTVPEPEAKRGILVLVLLAVSVLGAISGWFLLTGGSPDQQPANERLPTAQAPAASDDEENPAQSFIETFLVEDDWSYDSLVRLTLDWSALQSGQQDAARNTRWFRKLSDRLRDQILEQRALIDIDASKTRHQREQVLLSLARHLELTWVLNSLGDTAGQTAEAGQDTSIDAAVVPPLEPVTPDRPVQAESTQVAGMVPGNKDVPEKTDTGKAAESPQAVVGKRDERCPARLAKTRRPICTDLLQDGSSGPVMVVLPAGRFRMGSEHGASERPVHNVTIRRPFAISAYEVSYSDYQRYCKAAGRQCPAAWTGVSDPAVNVNWDDAVAYADWLSMGTGAIYRLPSEAEWEYAARAGRTSEYPVGDGEKVLPSDARFNANRPLPVDDRSVNVNGFKLRHIVGNVREWVADAWFPDYATTSGDGSVRTSSDTTLRVVRGGSYADDAASLRSAAREGLAASTRDDVTGFRLVRDVRN